MTKNLLFCLLLIMPAMALAQTPCEPTDRPCLLNELQQDTGKIDDVLWRDQTYRELAKTRAFDGDIDGAVGIVPLITSPDTKALTIRGIGMAGAAAKLAPEILKDMFAKLHAQAALIDHPPSHAIALTYIAMAQAFAGDDQGAWATAGGMENEALRHKAYGETAEIQAERNDETAALKSMGFITSEAYRNKSLATISGIFAARKNFTAAYHCAAQITNPYKKAMALQAILDAQKPRESIK